MRIFIFLLILVFFQHTYGTDLTTGYIEPWIKVNKVIRIPFKEKLKLINKIKGTHAPKTLIDGKKSKLGGTGGLTGIVVNSDNLEIKIWDSGIEDGDIVDIFLNEKKVLSNFKILKKETILKMNLEYRNNIITIVAVSEGTHRPNTAAMSISSLVQGKKKQHWGLKVGQKASLPIIQMERE